MELLHNPSKRSNNLDRVKTRVFSDYRSASALSLGDFCTPRCHAKAVSEGIDDETIDAFETAWNVRSSLAPSFVRMYGSSRPE